MVEIEELYRRWNKASESQKYMALLPLLEYGFEKGSEALVVQTPLTNYHIENLIEYALNWEIAGWWPELALNWVEDGQTINSSIYKILVEKEKKGSIFSQNQKHRAKKIANEWEKANET